MDQAFDFEPERTADAAGKVHYAYVRLLAVSSRLLKAPLGEVIIKGLVKMGATKRKAMLC